MSEELPYVFDLVHDIKTKKQLKETINRLESDLNDLRRMVKEHNINLEDEPINDGIVRFEVGKTYWTRSIGDHEIIYKITVAKRTAKTITTTEGKTLRPYIYEGREQVKPHGSYSMCAIIGADKSGPIPETNPANGM